MPLKKTSSPGKRGKHPVTAPEALAGEAPAPPCLVVAIGASAGGQEALEQIFTAMPTDCGVAFVVVMHLPPDGPSFLADMLGRYTTMEVVTAAEGMPLVRNRVHVIPAGRELTLDGDRLLLHLDGATTPRTHHPIDRLFRSIAETKGEHGIAVVLSGFGTDGTEGAKAVNAAGGMVIVQEPASAVSPAMPRSAIASGAAGLILPAEEIPLKIAEIARTACSLVAQACRPATTEEELHTIFAIVKAKTGHDFSSYKANTVMRRIERRMAVNDAGGIGKYVALLRKSAHEAHALCQDILIGVTSFFRDPEAFDTMRREIIPRLFAERDPDEPVRIWHACCATGEEVYSMAMLIREYLDEHRSPARVQLFATDIDEVAIAQARAGRYDGDLAAVLGEKRLQTFFTQGDGHWQVAKSLRELVVFAHHSLIKDPPFSRLDLLVCRNFLIYLNPDMQKRLISLFHQVLRPGGFLFLGSAESVGHHSDQFDTMDKKWKIFTRREGTHRVETPFPLTTAVRLPGKQRPARPAGAREPYPQSLAERFLVERYAPPGVVINEKYEVVHTSSRTGRFLEVPVGEPTRDILKMAREELRPALRAAIYKGFAEQAEVVFRGVKVGGDGATVNILVKPLQAAPTTEKLLLVVFEPAAPPVPLPAPVDEAEAPPGVDISREALISQLEEQLHITHEQLQATTEQLESSNEGFLSASEELMSINEEFQSANEELQSTNEELETSKEELQALNEELVTVNSELQGKVEELNQTTTNMENLLASSGIATVFLDRRLHLRGFTPAAAAVFNLIPSDTGRPFRHFAGRIDWPGFSLDAETVLAGEPFAEREVTTLDSERCYLKRLVPYRTPEGGIDGIVVTLIDITERKRMDEALLKSEEQYRGLVESAQIAIFINRGGRIEYANPAAVELFGADKSANVLGRSPRDFVHPDFHAHMAERIKILLRGGSVPLAETSIVRPDGSERLVEVTAITFVDRQGIAIQVMMHDITERKRAEAEAEHARDEWELTFNSVPDLIAIIDHNHRLVRVNRAMAEQLGRTPEECVGLPCHDAIHGSHLPPGFCPHARTLNDGGEHCVEVFEESLGGDYLVSTSPLLGRDGEMIGSVHVARNISERKQADAALRESEERYRTLFNTLIEGFCIIEVMFDADERPVDYRFLEINSAFEAQTGLKDAQGKRISELVPENEAHWFEIYGNVALTGKSVRFVNEAKALNRWYDVSAYRVGGPASRRVAILFNDITEIKQAEEALRASEEQFRTLADAIPQLCWTANADGWITWYNRRWYEYTGTTPEQMEGWGWQSVHDPQALPAVMERWQASIATGAQFDMVFPLLGADGVFRPFLTRVMPMRDQVGTVIRWFGTNTDITERKHMEDELLQAKDAAEAATRTKSRFLANMSHELRTPMTGVLGMLDHALAGNLEAEQRDFIAMAHASAHSLLRILNDILDLTKIEAGKLSIDPKPFLIRECVQNTVNILLPAARSKGIDLSFTVEGAVPERLTGDQTRLNQILTNLAGNAVKFTEKGTVAISVTTDNSDPTRGRMVTFSVADTGIGIPDDKKALLFREFSQVDDSHSRSYGGTGLGLAISREIAERMGGRLTFTSEEGKGSCFSCTIPFGEAETGPDAAAPERVETKPLPPASGEAKPRLLLAEDDHTIRKMLQVMLQRTNYELDVAGNGQEVVEMWEKGGYDLILMDVQMPRMNGFEATAAIREKELVRGGHIPIIAMTAHALKEDEERCLASGMDAYISKPIDFNACRRLIGETLEKAAGVDPETEGSD